MRIHDEIIQNTDEWFAIRLGKATSSNFAKVLAKGQGKTRKAYMLKLAAERLTGEIQDSYSNSNMDWGSEHEGEARRHYETIRGMSVEQVGFVEFDDDVGCSPDGLIGDDGLLEIKCPNTTTHMEYIIADKLPTTYKAQVQGQLWVTGREWCDFVSFDPRMDSNKMFCVRVERDQNYIDNLQYEVEKFVKELKDMCSHFSSPF